MSVPRQAPTTGTAAQPAVSAEGRELEELEYAVERELVRMAPLEEEKLRLEIDMMKKDQRAPRSSAGVSTDEAVRQYLKGMEAGAQAKVKSVAQAYAQAGFDAGVRALASSFVQLLTNELPTDQAVAVLKKGLSSPDQLVSNALRGWVAEIKAAAVAAAKP